ncbi:unnamed protein product [marine sediment metagenome]|uniref:Uncharacterized protein n=1 Tax=marine sediment metagenome TaxID=412755 RepID=X1QI71_9ZZZZ
MEVKITFEEKEKKQAEKQYPMPKRFFDTEFKGDPKMVEKAVHALRAVAINDPDWRDWKEI